MPRFQFSSKIDASVESVFGFHERPDALELLTPPWQRIEVMRRTGGLEAGAEVEFRLLIGPLRLRWIARHTAYEKNRRFVDEQIEGPFRRWVHSHAFVTEDGGARLTDRIEFSLPGGWMADLLFGWLVRAQLRRLFDYRHRITRQSCSRAA